MKQLIFIPVILFFVTACNFEDNNSLSDPNYKRDNFRSLRSQLSYDFSDDTIYPIEVSTESKWIKKDDCYQAVFFGFADTKSAFYLERGALIPPEGTPEKAAKEGTAEFTSYRYDPDENDKEKISDKEIIFTFGPHGSVFDPPAIVIMDFGVLETEREQELNPKVFYIEDDGTYSEQPIDFINSDEKWLKVNISHFSRYAMSYGK